MSANKGKKRIPGPDEWRGYDSDLDVKYAHGLLFGKSLDEVQPLFAGGRSIERADELLFMPRGAFTYYVQAFARYVLSDAARGDSDAASSFLRLLVNREGRDAGSVAQVYGELAPAVDFVAGHQEQFDASPAIYGDFGELAATVRGLVKR